MEADEKRGQLKMGQPEPPAVLESGILPSGRTSSDNSQFLDKAEIERLGRARPAVLSSWLTEVLFVATIVLSMTMSEYFIGGFNIILPPVADALNIPENTRTWPAGVINLTTAAFLMPFSRLCDIYGARSVFLFGHIWFMIWSLVCGFSQNTIMLIICRALQGVGTSAFTPAGLALLGQTYRPGPRKNLVFAIWGAFACLGFYFGIFMGAVTADFMTWRWYFWIGAIIIFCIAFTGFLTIPRNLHDQDDTIRMDWWGLCTIVPGLILVVFAFTDGGHAPRGWQTPYIYVTFIIGMLFLIAGVYTQGWVSAQPLLPADLFRPKYMKRLSLALFCLYGVFGLYLFYSSYYIETVLNTTPILTAAWFTPLAIGGVCLAVCGGFVMHMISNRILMMISSVGFLLSVLLFAIIPNRVDGHPSTGFLYWAYIFPAMLCGTIGVDITYNVTNVFITTSMPRRLQATAGGLINTLLYLGLAFWLGIAEMAVSEADRRKLPEGLSLRQQYKIGFWIGVAMAGLSLILVLTIKIDKAAAELTADEKAAQAQREATSN
ncbi:Drug resistance protein [Trichoderma lentiforme]|uniref:Drug resistance protein n=1 Tax=Trichoderma lentiforme TaxID=1567552 RepID=A0A9P4XDT9_9HYPO|nr:Drug resistance protein [Trichoderma lentiforme]